MARLLLPQRSVVLVAGVPGSGKSRLMETTPFRSDSGVFKIAADDVRADIQQERGYDRNDYVEDCIQEARERFFEQLHKAVVLRRPIVVEASYLTSHSRREMAWWANARHRSVHILLVTATWQQCVAGVVCRDRTVPIDILAEYWHKYKRWLPELEAGKLEPGIQSVHILNRDEALDEVRFADA